MEEKSIYLEVIFPAKLWQTFTYKAENKGDTFFQGQRVLVSLRNRQIIAFVDHIHHNTPEYKCKMILDIIDRTPIFPNELFQFLKKISAYYLAPPGMVLDSALPSEIKLQKFRTFHPVSNHNSFHQFEDIIHEIRQKPGIKYTSLKRKFDRQYINKGLNHLKKHRIIEEQPLFKDKTKKQQSARTLRFHDNFNPESIRSNAKRQIEIIDFLEKHQIIHDHQISLFSAQAIKRLIDKKIIQMETKDVTMDKIVDGLHLKHKTIQLNDQQQAAYDTVSPTIDDDKYKGFLLHGVTGSGKTEVYIKLIEKALQNGKSSIILVPEIALTTHLASRFYGAFQENIAIWHSGLTATERSNIWHKIASGQIKIVIGARSALFMPMENLGLIIVDEEHEQSYKQQNPAPRYHARDAALLRGFLSHATVLLGSATPSLESHYNALTGKLEKIKITKRYTKVATNRIHLVDIKKEFTGSTSTLMPFSKLMVQKIHEKLDKGQQVLLLHNRRGYSNFLLCANCGWTPKCEHCDITLTYHKNIKRVVCHYCDYSTKIPRVCPECGNKKFFYPGFGTQKIETILNREFPKTNIARLDMDSTAKKGYMHKVLKDFETGQIQMIVGTQMIAKGLDFPNVSLVGVLNADVGLFLPDFRARERVFQLLYQVSGRAGRGKIAGEVVIQTYNAEDFTVNCAIQQDIKKFINNEYSERNLMNYPPFSRIAAINFTGKSHEKVRAVALQSSHVLQQNNRYQINILGPVSNPISRIKNQYRYFILLKSRKEKDASGSRLNRLIGKVISNQTLQKEKGSVNISIDVDPAGLL
ncbi:MAG: primosomal protein N' [Fidelibacterota bacterium]